MATRPYSESLERLRAVGLRPTRQRLALARLLYGRGHRHVTAEQLHAEALAATVRISLATVYNSLHQFTEAGMLREVVVDPARRYFDTNVEPHHHFFMATDGVLQDISGKDVSITGLPAVPAGTELQGIDVIVRIRRN